MTGYAAYAPVPPSGYAVRVGCTACGSGATFFSKKFDWACGCPNKSYVDANLRAPYLRRGAYRDLEAVWVEAIPPSEERLG